MARKLRWVSVVYHVMNGDREPIFRTRIGSGPGEQHGVPVRLAGYLSTAPTLAPQGCQNTAFQGQRGRAAAPGVAPYGGGDQSRYKTAGWCSSRQPQRAAGSE
jgi:hypothetical protein